MIYKKFITNKEETSHDNSKNAEITRQIFGTFLK